MAWEIRRSRRYYTRSRKVKGRVQRQYVGCDSVADLVATADALRRADREAARKVREEDRARLQAALKPLLQLCRASDLLAKATLLLAGYYQHARSTWRRRRVNDNRSTPGGD